jgi:phage N-6-adenine-methyltransferase
MNAPAKLPPPKPLIVEQARDLLARAKTVDECKTIRNQASAVEAYLRAQKAAVSAQNDAGEIVLRAGRRIGELTVGMPKAEPKEAGSVGGKVGGRGKKGAARTGTLLSKRAALEQAGISSQEASRYEKLAKIPEDVFETHVAGVRARGERLTTSGTIAAVSHDPEHDGDEWGSPKSIVDAGRRVLGRIDLDPASNERAQKIVRAQKYYTKKDDGLSQKWKGPRASRVKVWLNPPFSQPLCGKFVAKLLAEHKAKRVSEALLILNAVTDTAAFHDLAREGFEFCLTKGRVSFLGPDGKPLTSNNRGQVIFHVGKPSKAFRREFGKFGTICQRVKP